jgi:hypothetical protein
MAVSNTLLRIRYLQYAGVAVSGPAYACGIRRAMAAGYRVCRPRYAAALMQKINSLTFIPTKLFAFF